MDEKKIGDFVDVTVTATNEACADEGVDDGTTEAKSGKWKLRNRRLPVIHWREARPPLVLCVALGRTNGEFEANVRELADTKGLREGIHFWHFC